MIKPLIFVLLCLCAIVSAGLFGALHNQLSYSIGPDYFTSVKLPQFQIHSALPPRIGAAQVGWLANWWIGLALAIPAMAVGWARISAPQTYLAAGLRAIGIALGCATLGAFAGVAYGFITHPSGLLHSLPNPDAFGDPEGFVRARLMHNGASLGGAFGGVLALWMMWRAGQQPASQRLQA